MKTIIKHGFALFLLIALLPGFSKAGNPDDKQVRSVSDFSAIKVSAGIDLILESGPQVKVMLGGDADDMDRIVTEVKNGTLHIYRKGKFGLNFDFHNDCEVHVTAKILNSLDASSGSEVKATNRFSGNEIRVNASSGSEVTLELEYDKVHADSSSGSEIHLSGQTKLLDVSVSSGSDIDACEMAAGVVHADASSGGEICVSAGSELHANASSGGDIEYDGNPATVDISKSSGGRVSKN